MRGGGRGQREVNGGKRQAWNNFNNKEFKFLKCGIK